MRRTISEREVRIREWERAIERKNKKTEAFRAFVSSFCILFIFIFISYCILYVWLLFAVVFTHSKTHIRWKRSDFFLNFIVLGIAFECIFFFGRRWTISCQQLMKFISFDSMRFALSHTLTCSLFTSTFVPIAVVDLEIFLFFVSSLLFDVACCHCCRCILFVFIPQLERGRHFFCSALDARRTTATVDEKTKHFLWCILTSKILAWNCPGRQKSEKKRKKVRKKIDDDERKTIENEEF